MKDKSSKFVRIISPIILVIVGALDIGVLVYAEYAIKRIIKFPSTAVILFAALDVVAIIIAVLVTKEVLSNGVWFYDDEFEFTCLDENNIFSYEDIEKIEVKKDESISLKKNFDDRKSEITLTLKNEKVITIDLGYTSKKSLMAVAQEISDRTDAQIETLKPAVKENKKDD